MKGPPQLVPPLIVSRRWDLPPNPNDTVASLLLCPNCNHDMLLFGVEPEGPKGDLYTFECDKCGRIEIRGVRIR